MTDAKENRQVRQQIVQILLPLVTTIQDRVDLVSASWNEQAKQQYEINYEGAGCQFAVCFISESLIIGRHLGQRDTSGIELVLEYLCSMVGVEKQAQINRLLNDLRDEEKALLSFREELLPFEPDTIPIPASPFLMGSDPGSGIPDYETPQFEISLTGYRIGRFPVTNEAFAAYIWEKALVVDKALRWQGDEPRKEQLKHLVTGVTWYEALAYCQWLSTKSGRNYQLANEASGKRRLEDSTAVYIPGKRAVATIRANLRRLCEFIAPAILPRQKIIAAAGVAVCCRECVDQRASDMAFAWYY